MKKNKQFKKSKIMKLKRNLKIRKEYFKLRKNFSQYESFEILGDKYFFSPETIREIVFFKKKRSKKND